MKRGFCFCLVFESGWFFYSNPTWPKKVSTTKGISAKRKAKEVSWLSASSCARCAQWVQLSPAGVSSLEASMRISVIVFLLLITFVGKKKKRGWVTRAFASQQLQYSKKKCFGQDGRERVCKRNAFSFLWEALFCGFLEEIWIQTKERNLIY